MDYLIQNLGAAPIYVAIVKNVAGKPTPLPRIMFEADKQITKVSSEIYEAMLANPFYRQKFEQGVLVPLNDAKSLDSAVKETIQVKELNYAKYVSLIGRINSTGGLSSDALRPFLDSEGFPSLDLARKNLGSNFEPEILEEFRSRYMIEKSNGLHESQLILPTGMKVIAGAEDVKLTKDDPPVPPAPKKVTEGPVLEDMDLESLKSHADEIGVTYDEDITFKRLLARVKRAQSSDKKE